MVEQLDSATTARLQSWIGRTETIWDEVSSAPVTALSATLDRDDPQPHAGDTLPPLWHWLYFMPRVRQSELGRDGHPALGGFLPPVPLPRRMWAGGRLQWRSPLRIGGPAKKVSTVKDVAIKSGKTGPLVFVTVLHEIFQDDVLCITEEHDIVYRDYDDPSALPPKPLPAPAESLFSRTIVPDPVLLFRYSALTFNGHRIHYDRKFCVEDEGYPGLIFHGPLTATYLVDLLRNQRPMATVTDFAFRAVRPLFDVHPLTIHGAPDPDHTENAYLLWALDHTGALAMTATARISPD
jgi:3-methylfumaryl-CoA hydratase